MGLVKSKYDSSRSTLSVPRVVAVPANLTAVHLAIVMPHSFFKIKEYKKTMISATGKLARMKFTVGYKLIYFF